MVCWLGMLNWWCGGGTVGVERNLGARCCKDGWRGRDPSRGHVGRNDNKRKLERDLFTSFSGTLSKRRCEAEAVAVFNAEAQELLEMVNNTTMIRSRIILQYLTRRWYEE